MIKFLVSYSVVMIVHVEVISMEGKPQQKFLNVVSIEPTLFKDGMNLINVVCIVTIGQI